MALDEDGPEEHRCLSALTADGRVVGIADLTMYRRENAHVAELSAWPCAPEARRQGVGTALVLEAERRRPPSRAWRAGGHGRGADCGPATKMRRAPFAPRLGFAPTQHMVRRELEVPLSAEQRPARSAQTRGPPAGLLPAHLRRSVARGVH